jgi:hypothetical protein
MRLFASVGRPIGKLFRRAMLALVPAPGQTYAHVAPEYLKFPLF